jgi:virulence factor Mce-like protein
VRRVAIIVLGLALLCGGAIAATGAAGGDSGSRYRIVFDNASGLVPGADFRVGGVAVGRIDSLDVQRSDARAIVTVSVSDAGFGGLRDDAACKIAQQSLIGEYYVECEPGKAGRRLPDNALVPVAQTESPIAADLVQNVMRRPYRERFSIILSELGAGFAARGGDVNETIRRAVPALTETQRVLKILGDNRMVLRRLSADSGRLMKVLGDRKRDVGTFVTEARDAATATAERRQALAATFRRFPGFLTEFTPTMRDLGTAAREQAPALADLRAAAPSLTNLLQTLGPFSRASEPAVTSLGTASVTGRRAAAQSRGTIELLRRLGVSSAEPAKNLSMVLSHLDDRAHAVEPDPDSPQGKGYTGLEAILQYPFDQSLAINIFDTRGYTLKLNALVNECSNYMTADDARAHPDTYKRCAQGLGPTQPGITTPDPSPRTTATSATSAAKRSTASRRPPAATQTAQTQTAQTQAGPAQASKPPVDLLDFLLAP